MGKTSAGSLHLLFFLVAFLVGTSGVIGAGCSAQSGASETPVPTPDPRPQNYVFFGFDHELARDSTFLNGPFDGAQLRYFWRQLEPAKDQYDFAELQDLMDLLRAHNKGLFVQIQDVTFSERIPAPNYLTDDPEYGGGVERKYERYGTGTPEFGGWVVRRWDPAVVGRLSRLLHALGSEFDGELTGINFAETALDFEREDTLSPSGYSASSYADATIALMDSASHAFSTTVVIEYANFMPGEGKSTGRGFLRKIYAAADSLGVGVGGPDILPFRPGQRAQSLPLIASRAEATQAGMAVQDGNLADIHPVTGERATAEYVYQFAADSLRLDYIFWGTEEPWFSEEVVPLVTSLKAHAH